MLHISLYNACESDAHFYCVKDDSQHVQDLIARKVGVVYLDLSATTAKKLEVEEYNKGVDSGAVEEHKRKRGGERGKKEPVPLSEDEPLQLLTDKIALWYESDGLEVPESDVGTFEQAPKCLMQQGGSIRRVAVPREEDIPHLTVVCVYVN